MPTFGALIQRTILRIGQVQGSGVQVYAEPILAEMMQHKFNVLFEERWWDDYMSTTITTLVGNGVVTADMNAEGLKRFGDIKTVHVNTAKEPLRRVPEDLNRIVLSAMTGAPSWLDPQTGVKVFRVYPPGGIGDDVAVRFRARPDEFAAEDTVLMDDEALVLGTAWDYLSDEGANPGAIEKMAELYNDRLRQLQNTRGWLVRDVPSTSRTSDDWRVVG
jgi:hypothetical protein